MNTLTRASNQDFNDWDNFFNYTEATLPQNNTLHGKCMEGFFKIRDCAGLKLPHTNQITTLFSNTIRLYKKIEDSQKSSQKNVVISFNGNCYSKSTLMLKITQQIKSFLEVIDKKNSATYFDTIDKTYQNQLSSLWEMYRIVEDVEVGEFMGDYQKKFGERLSEYEKNLSEMKLVFPPEISRRGSSSKKRNSLSKELPTEISKD